MSDVVALDETKPAAREAAALVSMEQRAAQRRRNRPCPGSDLHDTPVAVMPHHDPARVARQASRRFCGNARSVFED